MVNNPIISIIVPCFNESENINYCINTLNSILNDLINRNEISENSFIYFVDDGSSDSTWQIIQKASKNINTIKGLRLTKNFGHQNALLAGIDEVVDLCDASISIDADLQQDPKAIEKFINEFKLGNDLVLGVRKDRKTESIFKRYSAKIFTKLMKSLGAEIISGHADYRLMSQRSMREIKLLKDPNIFIRGMIHKIGFTYSIVYFDVFERRAGVSKYSFRKLMRLALAGSTTMSTTPLRIIGSIGFISFLIFIINILFLIITRTLGQPIEKGWISIIASIYLVGALQIISIAIIGEYIAKIFKASLNYPRWIIKDKI